MIEPHRGKEIPPDVERSMPPTRSERRFYGVLFAVSGATLLLELTLTRILDVILYSNLAYLIVSSAILGFGLAGLCVLIWPMPKVATERLVTGAAAAFAAAVLLLIPVLINSRASIDLLVDHPVKQLVHFGVLYLFLLAPFVASGFVISTVISRRADDIHRLYFWDLVGAGAGCLGIFVLPPLLGAGGTLLVIAAAGALAAMLAAPRAPSRYTGALAAIGLVACSVVAGRQIEFKNLVEKRGVSLVGAQRSEFSRWDPISKIDVLPGGVSFAKRIVYDGGSQSSGLYQFDGDLATLRRQYFDTLRAQSHYNSGKYIALAHWLKRDAATRALVIGSAGGQETLAALAWGAAHVDAVEMVCTVVSLTQHRYAAYIGRIFSDPRVAETCAEGRSFLQQSNRLYDVIQIHSNHTVSSLANGSGGAQPVYLQTVEAYEDYLSHLTPDGILQVNYFVFPRLLTTAAQAWNRLFPGNTFRSHLVITTGYGPMPTFLIKRSEWTPNEIDDIRRFLGPAFPDTRTYQIIYAPGQPEARNIPDPFFRVPLDESFARALPYDVRPPTDNWPFFRELRKNLQPLPENDTTDLVPRSTAEFLNASLRGHVPMERVHLYLLGGISLVASGIFLLVPLLWLRRRGLRSVGAAPTIIYFGCLGAGFIIVELVLMYKFVLLIGFPIYAMATVLFTLLVSAGIGSYLAESLARHLGRRAILIVGVFEVVALALIVTFPLLRDFTLGLSQATRIAFAAALIVPIGVPLGMPFPLGIAELHRRAPALIPWAWGVNGFMSVVGSLLAVVLSIAYGFNVALGAGLAIYAGAVASFFILARSPRADLQHSDAK
ncbi:MAG TPA: hypothetical protein VHE78_05170 [Gemmatimonadaceae bacterium]|nr:hypothetical protein [Gemmatimonadaceae bacterium]